MSNQPRNRRSGPILAKPRESYGLSKTKQSFMDPCDLNKMLAQNRMPMMSINQPKYMDCTGAKPYRESLDFVIAAQNTFMAFPAKIRSRFNNDPAQLLEFLDNPNNLAEARELGLIGPEDKKKEEPETPPTKSKVKAKDGLKKDPPQDAAD